MANEKWLSNDGLLYFWQQLKTKLNGKVDKVSGKGLSTNDYTTTEKNKLSGIESGANNYTLPKATTLTLGGVIVGDNLSVDSNGVLSADAAGSIEHIKVNGTEQTITDKTVNISVPTNNNQLTNGAGYQTASDVASAISQAQLITYEVVQTLPTTGVAKKIYLVPKSTTATGNVYDEYMWINNAWEKIGDTQVDLSNYVQKTDYVTNSEIDQIVAS